MRPPPAAVLKVKEGNPLSWRHIASSQFDMAKTTEPARLQSPGQLRSFPGIFSSLLYLTLCHLPAHLLTFTVTYSHCESDFPLGETARRASGSGRDETVCYAATKTQVHE